MLFTARTTSAIGAICSAMLCGSICLVLDEARLSMAMHVLSHPSRTRRHEILTAHESGKKFNFSPSAESLRSQSSTFGVSISDYPSLGHLGTSVCASSRIIVNHCSGHKCSRDRDLISAISQSTLQRFISCAAVGVR